MQLASPAPHRRMRARAPSEMKITSTFNHVVYYQKAVVHIDPTQGGFCKGTYSPKLATIAYLIILTQNIGSNPNAKRMAEVVSFYKKLPTGPAPAAKKPTSPFGKYKAAYFDGENASGKPLVHLAVLIIVLGYTWEYQSHLKHHKH